jgi:hypothetical protein
LDSLNTASDPGKLKRQKDWLVWSRNLSNYLSTILGQDRVPLSYIFRENDEPDYDKEGEEEEEEFDFEQLSIKCASLVGVFYKTHARKVRQLIHGYVQRETAEIWIKPKEKRQSSQLDLKLFRLTTVAKGTNQSGSRKLRSSGTPFTTRMKGQCPSKSS